MSQNSQNYKATFVLDMRDKTESVEEVIEQLKKEIEAENAEVIDVENLGSKEFARVTDREFQAGIFVEIDFRAPTYRPNALQERTRLNKAVNRVMVQRVA